MKYILLMCCVGLATAGSAQDYFSRWYSYSDLYGQLGEAVTTDHTGTIFVVSPIFCYRPGEEEEFYPCASLLRTDMNGELIAVDTVENFYTILGATTPSSGATACCTPSRPSSSRKSKTRRCWYGP